MDTNFSISHLCYSGHLNQSWSQCPPKQFQCLHRISVKGRKQESWYSLFLLVWHMYSSKSFLFQYWKVKNSISIKYMKYSYLTYCVILCYSRLLEADAVSKSSSRSASLRHLLKTRSPWEKTRKLVPFDVPLVFFFWASLAQDFRFHLSQLTNLFHACTETLRKIMRYSFCDYPLVCF